MCNVQVHVSFELYKSSATIQTEIKTFQSSKPTMIKIVSLHMPPYTTILISIHSNLKFTGVAFVCLLGRCLCLLVYILIYNTT